jgi:hypothetical protein
MTSKLYLTSPSRIPIQTIHYPDHITQSRKDLAPACHGSRIRPTSLSLIPTQRTHHPGPCTLIRAVHAQAYQDRLTLSTRLTATLQKFGPTSPSPIQIRTTHHPDHLIRSRKDRARAQAYQDRLTLVIIFIATQQSSDLVFPRATNSRTQGCEFVDVMPTSGALGGRLCVPSSPSEGACDPAFCTPTTSAATRAGKTTRRALAAGCGVTSHDSQS